jgi:UDP-N-acetylglucosamine acyltransferase
MPLAIHPSAIVDPDAQFGEGVKVGPYAIIEANVEIGDECSIGSHAVIKQYTRLGRRNQIHEHVVIGGLPQDLSFKPCVSYVEIGNDNILREAVTIHRATGEGNVTRIGDNNFLMVGAHVAHECQVGNQVVMANGAALGGYVSVGDRAFISAFAVIHQYCRVGRLAIVSGLAAINLDCLPFMITTGNPGRSCGVNRVGLKRAGFSPDETQQIKRAYGVLLLSGQKLSDALAELTQSESAPVRELVEFIQGSKRGFAHHRD